MTPDSLGMIAFSWPLLVVGVVILGLFAPQLLPKIGRMLGRMMRAEISRRVGLPTRSAPARPSVRTVVEELRPEPVEIIQPAAPQPTLRANTEQSLAREPALRKVLPTWLVGTAVLLAAGLIFWLLLHAR